MRAIKNKTAGFTLIEMLVGIVIGMIVVAAASVMMVSVLKSQKDITASARLNQELGAAMAVMSNEIRRAGFSVCDVDNFDCLPDADGNEVSFIRAYELGEDISIGQNTTAGDCILYRYNADVDENGSVAGDDYFSEHRGFRLVVTDGIGVIQIADNDDATNVACNVDARWITLTNPDVINITALSFSTAGSKCRNMTKNMYWTVGDGATGLACAAGTVLDGDCVDLNDPVVAGLCDTSPATVKPNSEWVNDDPSVSDYPLYTLFGVNQIKINLRAELTRDSGASKSLQTSMKVANPWIQVKKP